MRRQLGSLSRRRAWTPCSRPSRSPHTRRPWPPAPWRRGGSCRRPRPDVQPRRTSETSRPARGRGLELRLPANNLCMIRSDTVTLSLSVPATLLGRSLAGGRGSPGLPSCHTTVLFSRPGKTTIIRSARVGSDINHSTIESTIRLQ